MTSAAAWMAGRSMPSSAARTSPSGSAATSRIASHTSRSTIAAVSRSFSVRSRSLPALNADVRTRSPIAKSNTSMASSAETGSITAAKATKVASLRSPARSATALARAAFAKRASAATFPAGTADRSHPAAPRPRSSTCRSNALPTPAPDTSVGLLRNRSSPEIRRPSATVTNSSSALFWPGLGRAARILYWRTATRSRISEIIRSTVLMPGSKTFASTSRWVTRSSSTIGRSLFDQARR